ncbi:hypothetical protein [Aliarcobacter lanthieri]|uniref:hypothetical protein n=1 Tax=Aliarcobacter lanthieri TaxID=1355374 RepID=UPI00047E122F|nr:hypothetical protein [Aliarcobacter lanthieri]QKF58959.1 hypothetical protein ALANTH_0844 [Aliarcobacter lanthieri]
MNILKYREFIDTECSNNQQIKLDKKAIKIDGNNSLKMTIGCGDLKSCDYLRYKKDKILLIEISDLKKQFTDICSKTELLSKDTKKQLGKILTKKIDPRNIIRDETRSKYLETINILNELTSYVKFNMKKSKIFIIAICSNNISDTIALQYLERDLKISLNNFVKDVRVILANDLEKFI